MGEMQKRARMVREHYRAELGYLPSRREAGKLKTRDAVRWLGSVARVLSVMMRTVSTIRACRMPPATGLEAAGEAAAILLPVAIAHRLDRDKIAAMLNAALRDHGNRVEVQ